MCGGVRADRRLNVSSAELRGFVAHIFLTLLLIIVTDQSVAATPTKRSTRTAKSPLAPVVAVRSPRETALRHIGVAPFAIRKDSAAQPAQAAQLLAQFANDMTAMTYFVTKTVNGPTSREGRADLLKAVASEDLDGVIIGEISDDQFNGQILSRGGDTLATFKVAHTISLTNDAEIKAVSRLIVDEAARTIPYRGFITRQISDDRFEINLGKNQGILKGQRFRVFDFATSSFGSERVDKGEVVVVAVNDSAAAVEPTGARSEVKPFMKIGFNENAHGMVLAQQVETRGYAALGGGLLNISGTGDPKYIAQAYNVSSAPAFILAGGWNKYSMNALFAQAKGDDTDLVYAEFMGDYQFYETTFGGLNRLSVWGGARLARVSITTNHSVVSPLQSTTSISPEAQVRLSRVIKGPVRGYIAASAYYPIFVSGMTASALLFSYGVGGDAGLSIDFTPRFFADVGGRYHLIRRPVDGQSAVQETYTELYGDLGFRF